MTSLLTLLITIVQGSTPVEKAWGVIVAALLTAATIILLAIRWAFGRITALNENSIRAEEKVGQQKTSIDELKDSVESLSEKFDQFIEAGAESREKVANALNTANHRLESVEKAAEYIQKMRPLKHGIPTWADAVQRRIDCLEEESTSPWKGVKWPKLETDP